MITLVKESLNEGKSSVTKSAGLVIICNNKILLGHPTGQKWKGTYSIPKGHVEDGESDLDTAIRETKEEIGISINPSDISNEKGIIDYENNGKLYKQVYYFVAYLKKEPLISSWKLETAEIDHAAFFTKEEAKPLIFKRFNSFLNYLA